MVINPKNFYDKKELENKDKKIFYCECGVKVNRTNKKLHLVSDRHYKLLGLKKCDVSELSKDNPYFDI